MNTPQVQLNYTPLNTKKYKVPGSKGDHHLFNNVMLGAATTMTIGLGALLFTMSTGQSPLQLVNGALSKGSKASEIKPTVAPVPTVAVESSSSSVEMASPEAMVEEPTVSPIKVKKASGSATVKPTAAPAVQGATDTAPEFTIN